MIFLYIHFVCREKRKKKVSRMRVFYSYHMRKEKKSFLSFYYCIPLVPKKQNHQLWIKQKKTSSFKNPEEESFVWKIWGLPLVFLPLLKCSSPLISAPFSILHSLQTCIEENYSLYQTACPLPPIHTQKVKCTEKKKILLYCCYIDNYFR